MDCETIVFKRKSLYNKVSSDLKNLYLEGVYLK